ncbi:hypothetical protein A3K93_07370 [Acinetobacter sp. NCu2D-2]|uniref:hypothetical protein n=1 Tax=Acinetobacter sp. NCu2D-2 TaxID=1608473 RepID=UPI0007CDB367|nr:hypothetical protein [Acinetobacter sp. NCu2D-2]ANF82033.1 hypothetical protein A3K93_07370 [Acinetobacter sp. NCu2D-2]
MMKFIARGFSIVSVICLSLTLQACGGDQSDNKSVDIKPAPKLTNDATAYAHAAWELMNQTEALVYNKQLNLIEDQVRKPARKLGTDWRINVKMTDSVTEGKYALCRKALNNLEIWGRVVLNNERGADQKQADYERDKKQCRDALDQPELGNTDPKKIGV